MVDLAEQARPGAMELSRRTHWIFDMDGTLTVPAHDFVWMRAQLGIRPDQDILHTIAARSPRQAAADRAFIDEYENGLARSARAQADAVHLLDVLSARGCRLGVLTRNSLQGARLTLAAAGLAHHFAAADIVGRDCTAPKPDPAGVHKLLDGWGAAATDAVVVGDWVHDVRAGKRAGALGVLVRRHGVQPWESEADVVVDDLRVLSS